MRNIILIIKHEILTTMGKRSFWVMTFIFPLIILAASVGMQTFGARAIEQAEEKAESIEQTSSQKLIGYVDQIGLISQLPDWIPPGYLVNYPDEATAKAALEVGEIDQYYLIPKEFYADGVVNMVDRNYQPLRSSGNAVIFEDILNEILVAKEPLGLALLDPTTHINEHKLVTTGPDKEDPLAVIVPLSTLFIFFFVITTSSGFMLNSVTREKENRTAETLLVSLEPQELMAGKVIGLGVVAIFQMVVWMSGSLTALNKSQQLLTLTKGFKLPAGFAGWAIVFFLMGYFLYAAILGAIGALAPNSREGGQFTFIVILPLLIPMWFNYVFTESPNGPVATFLSLFPLTAPASMMTRMTQGNVALWQILLSVSGLGITTYIFILLASRFFRSDTLLSNESITWKRLRNEFRIIRLRKEQK